MVRMGNAERSGRGRRSKLPNGAKDDTHYSELGARRVATLAASEIHRLALPLAAWIKVSAP